MGRGAAPLRSPSLYPGPAVLLCVAAPARNGHKVGSVGKGSRVEMVDPRLKKDKRASKSRDSGKRGRSKSAPKPKKRYKNRH